MKICVLAPEFLPVCGGVGTYIVELVRHLPKNVEIHAVTPWRERVRPRLMHFHFWRALNQWDLRF